MSSKQRLAFAAFDFKHSCQRQKAYYSTPAVINCALIKKPKAVCLQPIWCRVVHATPEHSFQVGRYHLSLNVDEPTQESGNSRQKDTDNRNTKDLFAYIPQYWEKYNKVERKQQKNEEQDECQTASSLQTPSQTGIASKLLFLFVESQKSLLSFKYPASFYPPPTPPSISTLSQRKTSLYY